MAGSASVLSDHSTLSRLDRGLYRVERVLALVSGIAVLSLMILAVYSVGNTSSDTHLVSSGMASPQDMTHARQAGAVGVICCRYIDAQGQECALSPSDRLISAPLHSLKAARKKLLVVSGVDRLDATRAALTGGLVPHLCAEGCPNE